MFASAVMFPVFLGLSLLVDEPVPLFFPLIVFIVGLSIMLYSRLFEEPAVASYEIQQMKLGTAFGTTALPAAPNLPTNRVNAQKVRTSELAQPPSVTEQTTRFLDKD
ncbi:MAG TPA: hypothetical protein VFR80_15125 [Pyrinomonadaceae bacterium]|nr:hypothetical protein [Pyrinomonadaceae bacterium]